MVFGVTTVSTRLNLFKNRRDKQLTGNLASLEARVNAFIRTNQKIKLSHIVEEDKTEEIRKEEIPEEK